MPVPLLPLLPPLPPPLPSSLLNPPSGLPGSESHRKFALISKELKISPFFPFLFASPLATLCKISRRRRRRRRRRDCERQSREPRRKSARLSASLMRPIRIRFLLINLPIRSPPSSPFSRVLLLCMSPVLSKSSACLPIIRSRLRSQSLGNCSLAVSIRIVNQIFPALSFNSSVILRYILSENYVFEYTKLFAVA